MTSAPIEETPSKGHGLAANLIRELSRLEKRDWELWLIVALSGIVGGCTLLCLLFPTFFQQGDVHFEITISRRFFFCVVALLTVLNTYVASRRAKLRKAHGKLVAGTIQSELVRLQSFTDPLTEVFNRRSLEEMATRYISHARRSQEPLSFLVLDVDRFKKVNTRFGHITGDFVLSEMAGLLRSSTRGSDAVVRYGGDEFLIILAKTSARNAGVVVQRISEYLDRWNEGGYLEDFPLTVSVGVAEWTDGKTLDEVLDAADQDMYARKHRNRSATSRAIFKSTTRAGAAQ